MSNNILGNLKLTCLVEYGNRMSFKEKLVLFGRVVGNKVKFTIRMVEE